MKSNVQLDIKALVVGPIQACCYIVSSTVTPRRGLSASPPKGGGNKHVFLIDTGGDGEKIIDYLEEHEFEPVYLINTHGHIDHIGANSSIKSAYPAVKICVHQDDARMLSSAAANLSPELGYSFTSPPPDRTLKENDLLSTDDDSLILKVIHLPGHTKGGIGLLYTPPDKSRQIMFTGDTLFAGGVGRTDFPGGSMEQLLDSIRSKIMTLPNDTIIYPGHGPATTVGDEKVSNPFLTGEY